VQQLKNVKIVFDYDHDRSVMLSSFVELCIEMLFVFHLMGSCVFFGVCGVLFNVSSGSVFSFFRRVS
jgi:hypothetical protein